MARQEKCDKKTKFISNLEFLRERSGVSQRDLAASLGLSQSAVSLWINGATTPKSGELEKLACFFEVNMDDLWRGDVSNATAGPQDAWRTRAAKAEAKISKLIPACKRLAEGLNYLSDILDE